MFAFKPINFRFEIEELKILRDRSFFSSKKFIWKAAFVEFGKGLKVVHVIILY